MSWRHLGVKEILDLTKEPKPVDIELRFSGNACLEDDFVYRRAVVGRVPVVEIAALMQTHGDRLLDRNVRRFLGPRNRVNRDIAATLRTSAKREDFYFLNNGITMVCRKFRHNAIQERNWVVRAEQAQIINGGQTATTIRREVERLGTNGGLERAFVLVRLYELEQDDRAFVRGVTYATNNQNPVALRDLRADDPIQRDIEAALAEHGIAYLRQRRSPRPPNSVTPEELAEGILSVVLERPEWARFRKREHFGTLYRRIFSPDLTGDQLLLAVRAGRAVPLPTSGSLVFYARHYLVWRLSKLAGVALPERDRVPVAERLTRELHLVVAMLLVGEPSRQRESALFRRGALVRRTWSDLGAATEAFAREWRIPEQLGTLRAFAFVKSARAVFPDLDLGDLGVWYDQLATLASSLRASLRSLAGRTRDRSVGGASAPEPSRLLSIATARASWISVKTSVTATCSHRTPA